MVKRVSPKLIQRALMCDKSLVTNLVAMELFVNDIGVGTVYRAGFEDRGRLEIKVGFSKGFRTYSSIDSFQYALLNEEVSEHRAIIDSVDGLKPIRSWDQIQTSITQMLSTPLQYDEVSIKARDNEVDNLIDEMIRHPELANSIESIINRMHSENSPPVQKALIYQTAFILRPRELTYGVTACGAWRSGGYPNRGAMLLDDEIERRSSWVRGNNCLKGDIKEYAIALTTYGAALKDCGLLEQAESVAQEAVRLEKRIGEESYKPHCLLASIFNTPDRKEQRMYHLKRVKELNKECLGGNRGYRLFRGERMREDCGKLERKFKERREEVAESLT